VLSQPVVVDAPAAGPMPSGQIVPVRLVDSFYSNIPNLSIQAVDKSAETYFYDVWSASANSQGQATLLTYTIPSGMVFIVTDVWFYATTMTSCLGAPAVNLHHGALATNFEFNVTVNDKPPFDWSYTSRSALPAITYNPDGSITVTQYPYSTISGWPWLDTSVGSMRSLGFAMYARSEQVVKVTVRLRNFPRVQIRSVGVRAVGYTVPEAMFAQLFRRAS
jgi:hypothetical protein